MTDVLAERQEIEALIKGRSIAHAFADTVDELGDTPAFSDKIGIDGPGWRTLSWRELREQGLDLAAAFVELGVQPGDRVAIMASNRIEHVLADIGAMHAGATSMSIYNTLSRSQVAYVAEHSAPSVVVLETADHVDRWSEALATGVIEHVVVIDADDKPDGAITWDELVALGRSKREEHAAEVERALAGHRPRPPGDDPLHVRHDRSPQGRGDHPPQRALRGGEQQPHRRPRGREHRCLLPPLRPHRRAGARHLHPPGRRRPRPPDRRPGPARRGAR